MLLCLVFVWLNVCCVCLILVCFAFVGLFDTLDLLFLCGLICVCFTWLSLSIGLIWFQFRLRWILLTGFGLLSVSCCLACFVIVDLLDGLACMLWFLVCLMLLFGGIDPVGWLILDLDLVCLYVFDWSCLGVVLIAVHFNRLDYVSAIRTSWI